MISFDRDAASRVKLVVADVDGTMTDGSLVIGRAGEEIKSFSVRDGIGIKFAQEAGIQVALLSGRRSEIVERRAEMLGITLIRLGHDLKLPVVEELAASLGIGLEEVVYIGDDVVDLVPIREVGLGVAVADAAQDVLEAADCVTEARGGHGAVRETIEAILRARGDWDDVVTRYLARKGSVASGGVA
ncbi:MAG: HAD hydrolase family protein [Candidatus Eisenbacteria bacterium]|nr:HAD hydrolase family protein [Candidatus Eisenbacteria bacterium]